MMESYMPGEKDSAATLQRDKRAKPFVKWAGGKRSIINEIENHLPSNHQEGRYFEPFVGGGAVFFHRPRGAAILGDANPVLMAAYRIVKEDVGPLIDNLRSMASQFSRKSGNKRSDYYYQIREEFNDGIDQLTDEMEAGREPSIEMVAKFLFLNRTCFNGLYRVNNDGRFNVPMGGYANPMICNESNLRAASRALEGVQLHYGDFRDFRDKVRFGDFVYCDPPYTPLDENGSFTGYTADGFTWEDQLDLADLAAEWMSRGAKILLSNHYNEDLRNLYRERGFTVDAIEAPRAINSDASSRGGVEEVLIFKYGDR